MMAEWLFRRRRGISETKAYQKIEYAVALDNGLVTNTTPNGSINFIFVNCKVLYSVSRTIPYVNGFTEYLDEVCSVEKGYFVAYIANHICGRIPCRKQPNVDLVLYIRSTSHKVDRQIFQKNNPHPAIFTCAGYKYNYKPNDNSA